MRDRDGDPGAVGDRTFGGDRLPADSTLSVRIQSPLLYVYTSRSYCALFSLFINYNLQFGNILFRFDFIYFLS